MITCLTTSTSPVTATNPLARRWHSPRPDPPWAILLTLRVSTILLLLTPPLHSLTTPIHPPLPLPTNHTPNQCLLPTPLPPPRLGHASACRSKPHSLLPTPRVGGRQSRPTLHPLLASLLRALLNKTARITQKHKGRHKAGTHHRPLQPRRHTVTQQHTRGEQVRFKRRAECRGHQAKKDKNRDLRISLTRYAYKNKPSAISSWRPTKRNWPCTLWGPVSRPEEELDRLTKKLVYDMNHPPTEEYFGRCARCGDNVLGDGSGCIAMEQVFHVECFTCITCHARLRGQPFYALDKKSYCESCYISTLERCSKCSNPILDRILRAMGKAYHPRCFTCVVCGCCLDGVPFTVDAASQIHCIDDFHRKFAPRCSVCGQPIMPEPGQEETVRIVALDRSFHVNCYVCEECGLLLSSEGEGRGCYPLDGHILCKSCSARRIQDLSAKISTDC
ncbi:thyroid receptor-interacting protein 6 isoform X3 [Salminus brasiliensis]|uniref:thyroid receptor-interacting protein 6 isoform X3 n=1 Tax=Salminus brasiliensis TaxID=930266 RepID=UPI003B834C50